MTKHILFLFCFTISILQVNAQRKADPDAKDIAKAKQLKLKFNTEDDDDDDVALEISTDYVSFNFDSKTNNVTVRHEMNEKMINMNARADIQKYCFYDGQSNIENFKIKYKTNKTANFYVKDEAYKSKDLFHNDARVKYSTLDFPVQGYRYNTSITKSYKDIKYFTKLYFNDQYPIEKKTITVEIPNWLDVELKELNFEGYTIKKSVKNNEKNNAKIYTYSIEDLPAMFNANNAPGPTYIYPHILILAKSYTQNEKTEPLFNSTKDLYTWYKSLVNSLKNDNTAFKAKVAELIKDAKTDEEKIKNIYYWVQDNIRYIAFEDGIAGFKPDEASNVFNKRYGDCKGMANLTKQMLIEAGFDARLTWIGTKRIAYNYSTPNLSVDNHMICSLFKDDKIIFLDGTEKFNAFGEYANRIQGKQTLIEDKDNFILKYVPTHKAEFNKETFIYNLRLENETLIGSANKTYNGESRSGLLYFFDQLKTDKKDEFLESFLNKNNSNIKVSQIETSNLLDRDLNVNVAYNIAIKNAASSFDDSIYIDLDIDKELANYDFKDRKVDYIFNSKKYLESIITLKIPSGYKVSQLPKNIEVSDENYNLNVSFAIENETLIYKKLFQITNAKIETKNFEQWNAFITQLNALYKEQIILVKS